MTTKKTIAKRKSTEVANIQDLLKKQAAAMKDRVSAPKGNKIRIKTNKTFNFPDGRVEKGPIEVVIVDFINQQVSYENGFVEGEAENPTCWAINKNIDELKPSTKAPQPESTDCASCPMNQWGTDGKGKWCKMVRKMVVVDPHAEEPELMIFEVKKKAADLFDGFVNSIAAKYELPPVAVITELSFSESEDYPLVNFADLGLNEQIEKHFNLQKEIQPLLEAEFQVTEQETPKPKARRSKKKAVRR